MLYAHNKHKAAYICTGVLSTSDEHGIYFETYYDLYELILARGAPRRGPRLYPGALQGAATKGAPRRHAAPARQGRPQGRAGLGRSISQGPNQNVIVLRPLHSSECVF